MRQLECEQAVDGGTVAAAGFCPVSVFRIVRQGQRLVGATILLMVELILVVSATAQFGASQLKSFCSTAELGMEPRSAPIQGSDGALYGTTLLGGGSLLGTIFTLNLDGSGYRVIHRFTSTEVADGASPYGQLLEASDHMLYGTSYDGGLTNQGIVYRLNKDGSDFEVLHRFSGGATDGAKTYAGLVEGTDGALYGAASLGGSTNHGTVFRLNKDGTGYTNLHHFTAAEGSQPTARLLEAQDGVLYGTAYGDPNSGSTGLGTVFKLNKDGTGFSLLHTFSATGGDGANPFGGLIEGADGQLYGTTSAGGTTNLGTVFTVKKDGSDYLVLYRFDSTLGSGTQPYGGLLQGTNGALYGTTAYGGTNDQGSVFRLGTNGTGYTVLRRFTGTGGDGAVPYAGLIKTDDDALYGATVVGGSTAEGTVFRLNQDGGAYGVVHSFVGTGGEATSPYAGLIEGDDGAFYGTTYVGGSTNQGTVYRINRDGGGYGVLHHFTGGDGAYPYGTLLEAKDGVLYGTTTLGGSSNRGAVFKLNKDGTGYSVLHHFTGLGADGAFPYSALIEGIDGQLYGTTAGDLNTYFGSIFKLKKDGTGYTPLHLFSVTGGGGSQPYGGLVQGNNGVLYGVAARTDIFGSGNVYGITTSGTGYGLLHAFSSTGGDGIFPFAGLLIGSDGFLYGTTYSGGTSNHGTVFKLNPNGTGYTVLRRFTGTDGDGTQPAANAKLVEGSDGALYGVTYGGGSTNLGSVFKLNRDGSGYSVILNFTAVAGDGANPYGGLVKASDGALYGTTQSGGVGCGTVFRIAPAASFTINASGGTSVSGPPGYRFTVQYINLLETPGQWQNLTSITLSNSPSVIADPSSGSTPQRFYRAILNP